MRLVRLQRVLGSLRGQGPSFFQLHLRLMEQALLEERPTAPLLRMVKVGMRQVERLEQLVSNLLDVSQMTTGRLKLHTEVVDLSEVVGDVAARFASLLAHSGSQLELDIGKAVTGLWDRARLDQVVVNLLANFERSSGVPSK